MDNIPFDEERIVATLSELPGCDSGPIRATLLALADATNKTRQAHEKLDYRPPCADALVLSASHTLRWREAHLRENAPVPGTTTRFIGDGGLPLWDDGLLKAAADAPPTTRKLVLQQDFRFGNAIVRGKTDATHVERSLIGPLADRMVKTRGDVALDRLARVPNTLIVPWSLLGLRSDARGPATQRHAVWNIEEWYGTPARWEDLAEDRRELPEAPRTRLDLLFCDRELHPSPLAYLWLGLVAGDMPAGTAFKEALAIWQAGLEAFQPAAPPLVLPARGRAAAGIASLAGSGFLTATGLRLVADGAGADDPSLRARADATETSWRKVARSILKFRTGELPAVRKRSPAAARLFVRLLNPLIDIGTERAPSMIGITFLLDQHERLAAHAATIEAILDACAQAQEGSPTQLAK